MDATLLRFLPVHENCGRIGGFESVCVAQLIARNFVLSRGEMKVRE